MSSKDKTSDSSNLSFLEKAQRRAKSAADETKRLAKIAGEHVVEISEDAYENASEVLEDAGEKVAQSQVGQQAMSGAASTSAAITSQANKVVNSDLGKDTMKKAKDIKSSAKKEMKKAKEKVRRALIEKAVVVAGQGIDNAVDGVATSMGKDPFMPKVIIDAVDSVVNDIRDDAKIFVRENIEDMFEKHDKETKAKITATFAPCCKRVVTNSETSYESNQTKYVCNPLSWIRAVVLYTMTPNNRSFWWQIYQPTWWILTFISVFPSYGVSQVWWVLLFFLRDYRDEFQLVSFMVKVKTTAVISVGLIPSYIGIMTYLDCVEKGTCRESGPGIQGGFIFSTAFLVIQASLVYIAAALVPYSKDKGRRVRRNSMTASTTADGDERGQRRLKYWLIYDFVTVIICGGLFVVSWMYSPDGPSPDTFPKNYNINASAADVVLNDSEMKFLRGSTGHDLFRARVFWIRVLYGMLCMPWWVLKLPLMFPIILHAHPTAYNRLGQTVPFATPKEKGFYGHRCCKCSPDDDEIRAKEAAFHNQKIKKNKDSDGHSRIGSIEIENPSMGKSQ